MRLSVLFAVILVTSSWSSQRKTEPNKADGGTDAKRTPASQQPKHKASQGISSDTPPNTDNANTEKRDHVQQSRDGVYKVDIVHQPSDWWNRAYVVITGLLGAVGVGTLIMLWIQTKASHDAERARIDVTLHLFSSTGWAACTCKSCTVSLMMSLM